MSLGRFSDKTSKLVYSNLQSSGWRNYRGIYNANIIRSTKKCLLESTEVSAKVGKAKE